METTRPDGSCWIGSIILFLLRFVGERHNDQLEYSEASRGDFPPQGQARGVPRLVHDTECVAWYETSQRALQPHVPNKRILPYALWGVCSDTKAAEPMFEQDADRLAQCCPPTLTGVPRCSLLLYHARKWSANGGNQRRDLKPRRSARDTALGS